MTFVFVILRLWLKPLFRKKLKLGLWVWGLALVSLCSVTFIFVIFTHFFEKVCFCDVFSVNIFSFEISYLCSVTFVFVTFVFVILRLWLTIKHDFSASFMCIRSHNEFRGVIRGHSGSFRLIRAHSGSFRPIRAHSGSL